MVQQRQKKLQKSQNEFKLDLNRVNSAPHQLNEEKLELYDIETFYNIPKSIIKLFDDYSTIVCKAKYKKKFMKKTQNINTKLNVSKITNST